MEPLSSNDAALDVIVGQSRVLTIKERMKVPALVAVGDPSVVEFTVLSPRQIRILGERVGVTDLSVITADDRTYSFEVRVVTDLEPLHAQLRASFPDARLKLSQLRHQVVVEGQARDAAQVAQVIESVKAYLASVHAAQLKKIRQTPRGAVAGEPRPGQREPIPAPEPVGPPGVPAGAAISPETALPAEIQATLIEPTVLNLIRVPGAQQVLLKVRIAELDRTAMRQIGADFLSIDHDTGAIVGTQIGGAAVGTTTVAGPAGAFVGTASHSATSATTVFGIFQKADFEILLSALRRNSLLKILAEPNLMAMNGHKARFLAGGKFPVPIPQTVTGGVGTSVTVEFEPFGVELEFTPFILDNDAIRLTVHPNVSSIDFSIGTILVPGGSPVPGLNTREAETTVELREGQTLAIAGLMQLTLDGQTSRIPGLGDLPIIGPFFSNTTNGRIEKELIVLVTPYLAEPMNKEQVPPSPGDEVKEPNDLEFYFLNRIEGRTGHDFRSTTAYDDPLGVLRCFMKLENDHVHGPHGHCD